MAAAAWPLAAAVVEAAATATAACVAASLCPGMIEGAPAPGCVPRLPAPMLAFCSIARVDAAMTAGSN